MVLAEVQSFRSVPVLALIDGGSAASMISSDVTRQACRSRLELPRKFGVEAPKKDRSA